MPLKQFKISKQKSVFLAECDKVPPLMIIAGPNGAGKSTLLYSLRMKSGYVDCTGKILYIPPHRIWERQTIQAMHLWGPRRKYEDATENTSLSGGQGFNIVRGERTADSADESTKFIKFSLGQLELQRRNAIVKLFDLKGKIAESELPDIYKPLRELTVTLLPHLEFLRIDWDANNQVKCIWKRIDGLESSTDPSAEVDIDDLSSGEKAIMTLFMTFIEHQLELEIKKLQNESADETTQDLIVLMDEPELHLHPVLESRVLDYLRKIVERGNTQFIITTHSITLTNYASFDELYLLSPKVDDTTNQLVRLADDDDRLEALRSLCGDTYPLTACRKIICIEGELPEDGSSGPQDKKIFEILCPEITNNVIIPLGGKNSVIENARRLRENITKNIPGLHVFALVDLDQDVDAGNDWTYKLPVCMIENLLLKPTAINEFLTGYRERTTLKNTDDVKNALKIITTNLKNDEVRIRIKRKLGYIKESMNGLTIDEIKTDCQRIIQYVNRSLPNDLELEKIIENAKSEVESIMKEGKELNLFRGKNILKQFYDSYMKSLGFAYSTFCIELARNVGKKSEWTDEISQVIKQINSR